MKTRRRNCLHCGNEFDARVDAIARGFGTYCSRSCASKATCRFKDTGVLANIGVDDLRPLWDRRDIPLQKIADALGVTRQAITYHATNKLGLPARGTNQVPNKKGSDKEFQRFWLSGASTQEIADRFGYYDRRAVSQRRKMMGLPPRTRRKNTGRHSGWSAPDAEELMIALMKAARSNSRTHKKGRDYDTKLQGRDLRGKLANHV